MALDLSKLNFFSRLDARARVVVLFAGVLGVILLVYLGTRYFAGSSATVGPSRVAGAPAGLQSVPGGTSQSAEYQRALTQANIQRAEAAKMTGASSIPTQINTGVSGGPGSCVICTDQSANIKIILDEWVRQGKVSPDVAEALVDQADKNVPVEAFVFSLNGTLKEGKLTPEQARILLEEYKKQHMNALLDEMAKLMDNLIKSSQLRLGVANDLLDTQKKGSTTAEYADALQHFVQDEKLSPPVAQQLLLQFTKLCRQETDGTNIAVLNDMSKNGTIAQEVVKQLTELTNQNASVDDYQSAVNKFISSGKLTPDTAGKLINGFKEGKLACAGALLLDKLIAQAESEAYQEVSDLLSAGQITQEVGAQLTNMIQNKVSMDEFKAAINQMVQEKKLTPQIAQLKIGDYKKIKDLKDLQQRLAVLQGNNVTADQYADELKNAVALGFLTPEQAAQLMQQYQAMTAKAPTVPVGEGAFGALQQKVQQGAVTAAPTVAPSDFGTAQAQALEETAQERQARLQAIMTAMSGQASQLISSWQPPTMEHKAGSYDATSTTTVTKTGAEGTDATASSTTTTLTTTSAAAPLIKGGTIIFGVLDTAINSDYPDSPVLVTIVEGKYKGARLLGKIVTTKGVSGQMDRVSLNFTLMNEDSWPRSKTITAYAIDPDTARTVMASSVDYHYMMRFGAMFATSFMQGYATGITNAGTATTGIFGTSTTHPELNPSSKIMVALGQVGQTIGAATQNYINRPPTVRVDSGVSLGILFMSDVS